MEGVTVSAIVLHFQDFCLSMRTAPTQSPAENISVRLGMYFNLPTLYFTISVGMGGYRTILIPFSV